MLLQFADLIERHYEELHLLDVLDMGVPIGPPDPDGGAFYSELLRYYAGWTTKIQGETLPNSLGTFSYTLKEPVGVVGAIIPWNAPLESVIWKVAPALAAGCTVVLKPAEDGSLSPLRLGELLEELDLPEGVINIVTGYGETAGAALASHPGVDKVGFTGSTAVGQQIVRAANTWSSAHATDGWADRDRHLAHRVGGDGSAGGALLSAHGAGSDERRALRVGQRACRSCLDVPPHDRGTGGGDFAAIRGLEGLRCRDALLPELRGRDRAHRLTVCEVELAAEVEFEVQNGVDPHVLFLLSQDGGENGVKELRATNVQ